MSKRGRRVQEVLPRGTERPTVISDAKHKRLKAEIFREYGRAFALLAAYDRGEYEIPGR